MGGSMSRNKGQRGEREVIKLLQPLVDKVYGEMHKNPPELERNLMQTAKGGFDIAGLNWMALEVKYQEAEHIEQWWTQCKEQAMGKNRLTGEIQMVREPILFYRKNKVAWAVRMYGRLDTGVGGVRIKAPVIISVESFLLWFEHRLRSEFDTGVSAA